MATAATASVAMALAGRGGGGGGTADPMPSATAPATRPVERIAGAADPPPPRGIVVSADDPDPRIRTGRGRTARASTVLGEPQTLSLSDFAADTDGRWPAAAETRRGGALAGETAAGGVGGSPGSPTGRGGWLGHDFLIAVQATISADEIGYLSIPPPYRPEMRRAPTPPRSPGARPGRASWWGRMRARRRHEPTGSGATPTSPSRIFRTRGSAWRSAASRRSMAAARAAT